MYDSRNIATELCLKINEELIYSYKYIIVVGIILFFIVLGMIIYMHVKMRKR